MVGENLPDGVIFSALREWIPDDDKPDKELPELIAGARQRSPAPAHAFEHSEQPTLPELPNELADTGPIEFLNRIFHAGEYICITPPDRCRLFLQVLF
jgi:hypothetical protein